MSVKAEVVDKTTDLTEAYVNENKWTVCHNRFFCEFP